MKFLSLSAFLALLSTSVIGAPIEETYGAVYLLSNLPTGNQVVAADVDKNGTLSLGAVTDTGGLGGSEEPILVDPLQSAGSVAVSPAAGILAAVNAGSNTVSLFAMDKQRPSKLTPIGSPVSTFGDFPISVAFDQKGSLACVINSGPSNGVACYIVDPQRGLVAPSNPFRSTGFSQTNPVNTTLVTASRVVFSEDGTKVIAAIKGGTVPGTIDGGFVATWDIDKNAVLSNSFVKSPGGAGMPFSLTFINNPNRNAYLVADPVVGYDIYDFTDSNVAKLIDTPPIPGNNGTCWSTFSEETGNYYLADVAAGVISEVHINDDLTSNTVKQYTLGPLSGPLDSEVGNVNGVDILYVLVAGETGVQSFSLKGPGDAQVLQTWNATESGLNLKFGFLQGLAVYTKPSN